jgi:hypothetical protein
MKLELQLLEQHRLPLILVKRTLNIIFSRQ